MIVFLTLIYVGLLFLAVKLKLIRLNTFWKISPVIWMVLLFLVLFVPMQWGAPAGAVRMYSAVVEVVPNVSGEVVEVPVEALNLVKEGDVLFRIDPTQYEAKVAQLEAQIAFSRANLQRAEELMTRGVGRQLDVDLYAAEVNTFTAQLSNAYWELDETVVRAPSDGRVVGLSLVPGQRVANLPVRSWMAFVPADTARLAVGIPQSRLRYVERGQSVEVVLRLYPGRTFNAKVKEVVSINPDAQLQPSGILPQVPLPSDPALPFGVIIELDEEIDLASIPGGAVGTASIYTDSAAVTHVIRRIMVRMETWLNYIKP